MADGILERVETLLKKIDARLESGELLGGYIDQSTSPLGRKHNEAVRRRMREGKDGAAVVGRVHMLSPGALKEELRRESLSPALTFPHPADTEDDDYHVNLMREVGAE